MSVDTSAQLPVLTPVTHAEPPFDRPDANLILISSDNVHFHAHKVILAVASPVFSDMFSFPQPNNGDRDGGDLSTVTVSEDARTLYFVLRTCYPVKSPQISSLDDIRLVTETSQKYGIVPFEGIAEESLLTMAENDPVGVFAVACHYGLGNVAGRAAQATLKLPLDSMQSDHLSLITGSKFNQLLQYHLQCGREAARALEQRDSWFRQAGLKTIIISISNPCSACCITDPSQMSPPSSAFAKSLSRTHVWAPRSVWDDLAVMSDLLVHPFFLSKQATLSPEGPVCSSCNRDAGTCRREVYSALSVVVESAVKQVSIPSFV